MMLNLIIRVRRHMSSPGRVCLKCLSLFQVSEDATAATVRTATKQEPLRF